MSSLVLDDVGVRLRQGKKCFELSKIDFHLQQGEFAVLLGPSGVGKSTLLKAINGVQRITAGRILLNGREMQNLSAASRSTALVARNYSLFEHMSAVDNIALPLKLRGLNRQRQRSRVNDIVNRLAIQDLMPLKPSAMSGGQKQKVILARALVMDAKLWLLDEPFANVDPQIRAHLRQELQAMHQQFNATCLFVTHDQREAMLLADKLLLLNAQGLVQQGSPKQLFEQPVNPFVADYLSPSYMNWFDAQIRSGHCYLAGERIFETGNIEEHARLRVAIRAEQLTPGQRGITAVVKRIRYLGEKRLLECVGSSGEVMYAFSQNGLLKPGDHCQFECQLSDCLIFNQQGQLLKGLGARYERTAS